MVGRLLVATSQLTDPNFAKTVILLLSHDDDGALGVVLDQPTEVRVADVLPAWGEVLTEPDVLFHGGPVGADSALGLVSLHVDEEPPGVRRVTEELGLVDLDAPVEVVEPGVSQMRVFAGYAGWGKGQLEEEIDEGAWFLLDMCDGDVFGRGDQDLWRVVLRRQNSDLSLLSTMPEDPTAN